MNAEDLRRFADDLNNQLGLTTELHIDADPEGLHVLRIDSVDFFFYANGSGYDGWGRTCAGPGQTPPAGSLLPIDDFIPTPSIINPTMKWARSPRRSPPIAT